MRKMTILVDMDDVLIYLTPAWVDFLNARYKTDIKASDITAWDVSKFFPELTKEQVYAPLYEDLFWRTVKPIDRAIDVLSRLVARGHHVVIVTASCYQTLETKMEEVLFKNYPFLTWKDVVITSQKQLLKGDVLIDDAPHNLIGGEYDKVLMDAPHNRRFDEKPYGITRARSWEEIYEYIKNKECDVDDCN